MPNAIASWNVATAPHDDLLVVSYTCPNCHTGWVINVAKTETQTQLWCHKDGKNIILYL